MVNNIRMQVFEALKQQGAITNSKALSAKELKVDEVEDKKVATALSTMFNRWPNVIGRVEIPDEEKGTRYKYYAKKEHVKVTPSGRMARRKRRMGPTPKAEPVREAQKLSAREATATERAALKGTSAITLVGPGLRLEREVTEAQIKEIISILMGD